METLKYKGGRIVELETIVNKEFLGEVVNFNSIKISKNGKKYKRVFIDLEIDLSERDAGYFYCPYIPKVLIPKI